MPLTWASSQHSVNVATLTGTLYGHICDMCLDVGMSTLKCVMWGGYMMGWVLTQATLCPDQVCDVDLSVM